MNKIIWNYTYNKCLINPSQGLNWCFESDFMVIFSKDLDDRILLTYE